MHISISSTKVSSRLCKQAGASKFGSFLPFSFQHNLMGGPHGWMEAIHKHSPEYIRDFSKVGFGGDSFTYDIACLINQ